jgi:hypothetical protein
MAETEIDITREDLDAVPPSWKVYIWHTLRGDLAVCARSEKAARRLAVAENPNYVRLMMGPPLVMDTADSQIAMRWRRI